MEQEMPRPLTATDNGALSPEALSENSQTFNTWYHLANDQELPALVSVPFQDVKNKVSAFMQAQKLKEEDVACRFIHRLDVTANTWFTCLELCKMEDLNKKDPYGRPEYRITGYAGYRYDIRQGLSVSQFQGDYDPLYFNNVYYPSNTGTPEPLIYGQHVQSVVVPWMRELLRLCQQNNLDGVQGARLMIQSIAAAPVHQSDALVAWPHSLGFYMKDAQGNDCLGAGMAGKVFYNQAADFATTCPTNCSKYLMPANLPI